MPSVSYLLCILIRAPLNHTHTENLHLAAFPLKMVSAGMDTPDHVPLRISNQEIFDSRHCLILIMPFRHNRDTLTLL